MAAGTDQNVVQTIAVDVACDGEGVAGIVVAAFANEFVVCHGEIEDAVAEVLSENDIGRTGDRPLVFRSIGSDDDVGEVVAIETPDGSSYAIDYDASGRVTFIEASDGEYAGIAYDSGDRVTEWENADGTVSMSYGDLGGVEEITYPNGESIGHSSINDIACS